jgi:hypothetical protein
MASNSGSTNRNAGRHKKTPSGKPKHELVKASRARRQWLVNGSKTRVTGTATEDMTSGSVSTANKVRASTGGTRYTDRRKFPVTVTSIQAGS